MSEPREPLFSRFERKVTKDPTATALVFLDAQEAELRWTRADVFARASRFAAGLATLGTAPGDVTLVVSTSLPAQAEAVLGALYCGAVPCVCPGLLPGVDPVGHVARLDGAATRVRARWIVGDAAEILPSGRTVLAAGDFAALSSNAPPSFASATSHDVAVLQLSSGTTGRQKVVPITHAMAIGMSAARESSLRLGPSDVFVNCVPLHHSLGLLGSLIGPLLQGVPSVLLPTVAWLARPVRLMRAVHRHRGTISAMPNFGFQHCIRAVADAEMAGLCLDSWRLLACGGERVQAPTLADFARRFAPWGFRASALAAGYGLSEHTLVVSSTPPGARPRVDRVVGRILREEGKAMPADAAPNAVEIVSCGRALDGVEIRIGPLDAPAADRRVGEIFLKSPYVFPGYLDDPERTALVLRNGWLATGDLGYLADGELYVCGRQDDLIIVGGSNVMAEDAEAAVAGTEGVLPGRVVAVGIPDPRTGTDALVLVAEIEADAIASQVERRLRFNMQRELGMAPTRVLTVASGWIVLTPAGKTSRAATRQKLLAATRAGEGT
jgi:fatty-acyl-CoA synthase